jgi:hypothetical protein
MAHKRSRGELVSKWRLALQHAAMCCEQGRRHFFVHYQAMREQITNKLAPMTHGERLGHSISCALGKAQKIVRGLGLGLTDKELWDVACKTVDHLKEPGDKWKLIEALEDPFVLRC